MSSKPYALASAWARFTLLTDITTFQIRIAHGEWRGQYYVIQNPYRSNSHATGYFSIKKGQSKCSQLPKATWNVQKLDGKLHMVHCLAPHWRYSALPKQVKWPELSQRQASCHITNRHTQIHDTASFSNEASDRVLIKYCCCFIHKCRRSQAQNIGKLRWRRPAIYMCIPPIQTWCKFCVSARVCVCVAEFNCARMRMKECTRIFLLDCLFSSVDALVGYRRGTIGRM